MKLKDTEMYSFCVGGREKMRHLFYECRFMSYFSILFSNLVVSTHRDKDSFQLFRYIVWMQSHRSTNTAKFLHSHCEILYIQA